MSENLTGASAQISVNAVDTTDFAAATPDKHQPWRELGLKADEYDQIREILGRRPTSAELAMYSVMWSEHCSYKSSKIYLRQFGEKVTPEMKKNLMVGMGENAGVVDIGEGWAVTFKVESHNHPSYIEPFQGAATGVGGIVRDILTMGARPIAVMDQLRFGAVETLTPPVLCTAWLTASASMATALACQTLVAKPCLTRFIRATHWLTR